jgi:hypothetical protein
VGLVLSESTPEAKPMKSQRHVCDISSAQKVMKLALPG